MLNKVALYWNLAVNMGLKYLWFRSIYKFKLVSGKIRKDFPINPVPIDLPKLETWRKNLGTFFFFSSKEEICFDYKSINFSELEESVRQMKKGKFLFFSSILFELGRDYSWVTNPDSGFTYDITKHWSQINDYSKQAGDIKYVWEKARFGFLYDIIRYDYYSAIDQSEWVFSEIEDFIEKNPINQGPNYKCSQEISLRILNWTFALFYYKQSKNLTEERYRKLFNSIYWQYHHVYHNINFSRIAVRNNHAITETLALYLIGLLYPFFPNAESWKIKGKKWFEEEISYQVFEDGGYLQYSHNYHRVVIQLLTWALRLAELNGERFSSMVYEKARLSLDFLFSLQETASGWLPNYGMNDGALFFKLNDKDYRNFKPQLQALSYLLNKKYYEEKLEDSFWYGINPSKLSAPSKNKEGSYFEEYKKAGIFLIRDNQSKTIINAVDYKTRPAQADGLNLDIWIGDINVIRDPGTYKYNTEDRYLKFYFGTSGHNTLSLGDYDQMYKGPRFIWYYWTKANNCRLHETDETIDFEGEIMTYRFLYRNIVHNRRVSKEKTHNIWKVTDMINYNGDFPRIQHWNIHPLYKNKVNISCKEADGNIIRQQTTKGWYSEKYGKIEEVDQVLFKTKSNKLITTIEILET